jgi:hypothetical protein
MKLSDWIDHRHQDECAHGPWARNFERSKIVRDSSREVMLHELLLALLGTPSLVLAHASRTYSLARQERARLLCFGVRVRARVRIYQVCFRAHTCVLVSACACARLFACLRVSARVLRTRARECVSARALACACAARVLWAWIFVSACATQYIRAIYCGVVSPVVRMECTLDAAA